MFLNGLSKDELIQFHSELNPLINRIKEMDETSENSQLLRNAYFSFQEKFDKAMKIYKAIEKQPLISPNFYLLYIFLGAVESVGNIVVNVLILLVVANGNIFKDKNKKKYTKMEDFENKKVYVSLGEKLDFLKRHKITVINSGIDTELRNSIAHLNFEVKENEIFIRGKPAVNEVFIGMTKLMDVILTVSASLNMLAIQKGWIHPGPLKNHSE